MAELWPDGMANLAAGASSLVVPVVCVVLAVVLIVHTARTAVLQAWLATGAAVLVLAAFAAPRLSPLWFFGFPLLASVFPDGRFVPRWTVVPVALCAVPATVELASPGALTGQPWWAYWRSRAFLPALATFLIRRSLASWQTESRTTSTTT